MGRIYRFNGKRVTGMLSVVPKHTVRFQDELDNYGFSKEKSLNLQRVMGFGERRIVEGDLCTSDLLVYGMRRLFDEGSLKAADIGALVLVTQTPDYFMPPTSTVLHGKLGLDQETLCFDINQGCTGFLYGLLQSCLLLEVLGSKKVVLMNGDTLSRSASPFDRNIYPIIGDAATITVVENGGDGDIVMNMRTDGSRADWLIIPAGGFRMPTTVETRQLKEQADGNRRSDNDLFMNGTGIFAFTQTDVPPTIHELFSECGASLDDVDYFMFHQPNRFMLEKLRAKLKVPTEKLPMNIVERFGNSSSATIPITICHNIRDQLLKRASRICMGGFGVGLTWGTALMSLGPLDFCDLVEM